MYVWVSNRPFSNAGSIWSLEKKKFNTIANISMPEVESSVAKSQKISRNEELGMREKLEMRIWE